MSPQRTQVSDVTVAGPLEPGDRLGLYCVERELGTGGQGTVYLARDTWIDRRVAIKVQRPGLGGARRMERFRREATAASRIDDPGIATVLDVGMHGAVPFFVMRYVEGETLAERVSRERGSGPPSGREQIDTIIECFERIARSVHAAHEAGVTHRDLKPGNIVLTPEGDPVVLDFGLARDEESPIALTLSGDVFGTPAYMAPEQIASARRADRRTDVYAIGATLYECLTHRPPLRAATRDALYRAILVDDPPDADRLNPAIPRDLAVVLATTLTKEPDGRYRTAADLAEDLRRVRNREPISVRPVGPVRRGVRWALRRPDLSLSLGGLIFVLAVALAVTGTLLVITLTSLAETRRMLDVRSISHLQRVAETDLWPVAPAAIPDFDSWLAEAGALHDRVQDTHDVSGLASAIEAVQTRREDAATLAERTIDGHAPTWRETIEAIAGHPAYGGLRIRPQLGLVPLGRDPDSGLFEFVHVQTGAPPRRDPATNRLTPTGATGIVLVLIPAGRFAMGARDTGAGAPLGAPNVDPYTRQNQDTTPVHEVTLDAFFISKYEMTQGQWLRATGVNPSRWSPGSDAQGDITLRHPVENISWAQAADTVLRFGLVLPTEAQWEYAARAGTTTTWWTGADRDSLLGAVNLVDQSGIRAGATWPMVADWPGFDDGWVEHAPVGTFRANPWGLHEVLGNVWELVLDPYGSYDLPVRPGDGLRLAEERGVYIARGGGFYESLRYARSARRYQAGGPTWSRGLRPARGVDP